MTGDGLQLMQEQVSLYSAHSLSLYWLSYPGAYKFFSDWTVLLYIMIHVSTYT